MFGGVQARQAGQLGKALSGISAEMQAENDRQQSLNDAVARQKIFGQFERDMIRLETEAETQFDISDPSTVSQFQTNANAAIQQALQSHGGSSADSMARLQIGLNQLANQSISSVSKSSESAKRGIVIKGIEQQFSDISASAIGGLPLPDAEKSIDDIVDSDASSLTSAEEAELRISGRAQLYSDLFNHHMTGGGYERNITSAEELLKIPGVQMAVGDVAYRKMKANLFSAKRQQAAGTLAGQNALSKAAHVLGIGVDDLTEIQREKIARVFEPRTAAQKNLDWYRENVGDLSSDEEALIMAGRVPPRIEQIAIEAAIGRELTENQKLRLLNISPPLGEGLKGLAMSRVWRDMDAFASNTLNPDQERMFLAAVSSLAVSYEDKGSGVTLYRIPGSGPLQEAFWRRGEDLVAFLNPAGGERSVPLDRFGVFRPPDSEQRAGERPAVDSEQQVSEELDYTGITMWDSASEVAGIPSMLRRAGRAIPIGAISREVSGGPTRSVSLNQSRLKDLTRVLQNNPRYADTERQAIEKALNIEAGTWTSPDSYRDRLEAVHQVLTERRADALKILNLPSTKSTLEERRWAMEAVQRIDKFLPRLGVPVEVEDEDDIKNLAPGTLFRYKGNGLNYRVPRS